MMRSISLRRVDIHIIFYHIKVVVDVKICSRCFDTYFPSFFYMGLCIDICDALLLREFSDIFGLTLFRVSKSVGLIKIFANF